MAAPLTWTLRLTDGITPGARTASRSLVGLERDLRGVDAAARGAGMSAGGSMRGAQQGAEGARSSLEGMRATLNSVGGSALSLAGIVTGIATAFGLVSARIGAGFLEMVRFREAAVTTMGVLGGGRGRAGIARVGGAAFGQAQALGRLVPAETRDVIGMQQRVATAGFRGGDAQRAMAAALDVQALQSSDASSSDRFLTGMSQMMGRSRLTMEDLRQTAQAAGLNTMHVQRRAAEMAGITRRATETEQQFARRIEQAMTAGRMTGAQGMQATLAELSAVTGQGLGGFARAQGNTLGGAMSNMSSAVDDLILGIAGLENLPGVQAFSAFARSISSALDGTTAQGRELQGIVSGLVNSIGTDLFAGLDGGSIMREIASLARQLAPLIVTLVKGVKDFTTGLGSGFLSTVRPALDLIRQLSTTGRENTSVWRDLGTVIGFVLGAFALGVGVIAGLVAAFAAFPRSVGQTFSDLSARFGAFFSDLGNQIVAFGERVMAGIRSVLAPFAAFGSEVRAIVWGLSAELVSVGASLVEGLIGGIRAAWPALTGVIRELTSGLPGPVRSILGIASPSRVFAEIGRQLPAGMAQGIQSGARDAQGAAQAMVNPGGLAMATGSGASVSIVVNVSGADTSSEDLGDTIAARIEEILGDVFGRAALAGGA